MADKICKLCDRQYAPTSNRQLYCSDCKKSDKFRNLFVVWSRMIQRCNDSCDKSYNRYGGRGIKVCLKWQDFANFYRDMHSNYKKMFTLDRIDNNIGYSKENCRWATKEQQANNRRDNRIFNINGKKDTFANFIKDSKIKSSTARQRFYVYQWSVEKSLGLEV